MKLPNITPGEWHVAADCVWAGKLGLDILVDLDDHGNATKPEDLHVIAAAPDMMRALNNILAELKGRCIHLDNATGAIVALRKAGAQFNGDGSV